MSDLRGAVRFLWKASPIQRKSTCCEILKLGPTGRCRINNGSTTSLRRAETLHRKSSSVLLNFGRWIHTGCTNSFIYQPLSHYSRIQKRGLHKKVQHVDFFLKSVQLTQLLRGAFKSNFWKNLGIWPNNRVQCVY